MKRELRTYGLWRSVCECWSIDAVKSIRSILVPALVAVIVGGSCRVGYDKVASGEAAADDGTTGGSSGAGSGEAGGDAQGGSSRGGSAGTSGGTDATGGEGGEAGTAGTGTSGGSAGTMSMGGSGNSGGRAGAGGSNAGGGVGGSAGAGAGTGGGGGSAGAPDPGLCNSATFGGHMYLLCRELRSFPAANDGCTAVGMRLVRIDDAAENQWLFDNASTEFGRMASVWIGATDQALEGEWRWTDGTLFWIGGNTGMAQGGLFAAWYFREPNDVAGVEHCASMETQGSAPEWYDWRCETLQPFVCESL
jgi:hypothetical protein